MRTVTSSVRAVAAGLMLWATIPTAAQQTPVHLPDIPEKFARPTTGFDYEKRVAMIPMRDGVKLYTVIVVPKGARNAPMIMTRTPYNAAARTTRAQSASMLATLPQGDEVFVADGYIRVFQAGPTSSPTRRRC
jgi:predicted acyl esterase